MAGARQLDDAAFDRVHEREVARRPWEQSAFCITGAAKEERRRGQIDDATEAELAVHGFQAGNPEARRVVVLFRLLSLVAFQILVIRFFRLLTVAVVRFIIDDRKCRVEVG